MDVRSSSLGTARGVQIPRPRGDDQLREDLAEALRVLQSEGIGKGHPQVRGRRGTSREICGMSSASALRHLLDLVYKLSSGRFPPLQTVVRLAAGLVGLQARRRPELDAR